LQFNVVLTRQNTTLVRYTNLNGANIRIEKPAGEVRSRQCPLLWTWVLEKMGMLEIMARLTDKQPGDTRFTQVQAPGGKTLLLLVCS
ncbi:hypothetical protein Q8G50_29200, partial [Klebsiella pneumoniae]